MPRRHRGTAQGDDLDDNGHTTADPVVATLPHWGSAAGGRRRAVIPLIETPLAPRCKKKASCHFDHPARATQSIFDEDWAHHPLGRRTWPSAQIRPVREIALRYSEVCCWGVSRP